MEFLVILLGLIVTSMWLKDVDRFDDGWFARYQALMRGLASRLGLGAERAASVGLVLVYLGLLALTAVLEWAAGGVLYGLATMALHLLILLFAMDRTQPGKLASEFLALWNSGERSGCVDYLAEELGARETLDPEDGAGLVAQFKRLLTYRSFERMFMMYTLYVVAGASGVVIGYVSYQLRSELCAEREEALADRVDLLISLLEWLPLRLLGITFSLVGDFTRCASLLKSQLWRFDSALQNSVLLASWARASLGEDSSSPSEPSPHADCDEAAMGREIESLKDLLERSQLVWLVFVALITLLLV